MNITTKQVEFLPDTETLLRRMRAAAALDAVLMPTWHLRYYSYDPQWGGGLCFGSMKNGSGEEYYMLTGEGFALIKGFVEASKLAEVCAELDHPIPELLPAEDSLEPALTEPALDWPFTTYVASNVGKGWTLGCGSGEMSLCKQQLRVLLDEGRAYHKWAEEYFEMPLDGRIVKDVFLSGHLNQSQLAKIGQAEVTRDLLEELRSMGAIAT